MTTAMRTFLRDKTSWLRLFLLLALCMALVGARPFAADADQTINTVTFFSGSSSWTVPTDVTRAEVLIVGGGGGGGGRPNSGGTGTGGGGGGGGGVIYTASTTTVPGTTITIIVGGGGSGATSGVAATNGGDSTFGTTIAKGGGGGGNYDVTLGYTNGRDGGSGGGAPGLQTAGNGTSGQGNNGGSGAAATAATYPGGGGGGAGGAGGAASGATPGNGGTGVANSMTGSSVTYGCGGGASSFSGSTGSAGCSNAGAGTGTSVTGGAGTANTGGGGGAGGDLANGGAGGSGVIRINYVIPFSHTTITLSKNSTVTGGAAVLGALSKGSGTFVIDDPLDPKNKLLYHSFVESPDVKNIYDGIATLDNSGKVTVTLPGYFFALNKDFRYLATPIGQPMPNLYLSSGVHKSFFGLFGSPVLTIAGGAAGGKISWQVTGIRHDPFILAHPIIPEVAKGPGQLVGKDQFLFPEFYAK